MKNNKNKPIYKSLVVFTTVDHQSPWQHFVHYMSILVKKYMYTEQFGELFITVSS